VSLRTLPRHRFTRTSAEGGGGGAPAGTDAGTPPAGGAGTEGNPPAGPPMAKDEQGNDLGYPLNTAVAEMTDGQRANYWRFESKKQQKAREDAERKLTAQNGSASGTVPDQQKQNAQPDDKAVQARIDEARREGQRDAVVIALTTSLQMRERTKDEIDELLGVVDPNKFLGDDGKVDSTKVANYISRVAPVGTAGGGGNGAPGQGRFEHREKADPREVAREEAKRRGHLEPAANRGALGGLRK
jgi:hypothetical protein